MVRKALDDIKEGVNVGGKLVKEIRIIDNICLIASKKKCLCIQKLISSLDKVTECYSMKISLTKLK